MLLKKSGGLIPLLTKHYPEHDWTKSHVKSPSKVQLFLWRQLQKLFPGVTVLLDSVVDGLRFSDSRAAMLFDAVIPQYCLVFEYQVQHIIQWCTNNL
jgi:hypothetical protein